MPTQINSGLYSSHKKDWATPPVLFEKLNRIAQFNLDVCASDWNARCKDWIGERENGLTVSWHNRLGPTVQARCWMNPPYGRDIGRWVNKAIREWREGAFVVALLPARTDTAWFQTMVFEAPAILFLDGRVPFMCKCAVDGCRALTNRFYVRDGAKPNAKGDYPHDWPLCREHSSLPERASSRTSVAPFPSCVAWFTPRDLIYPGLYDLLQLEILGHVSHLVRHDRRTT